MLKHLPLVYSGLESGPEDRTAASPESPGRPQRVDVQTRIQRIYMVYDAANGQLTNLHVFGVFMRATNPPCA